MPEGYEDVCAEQAVVEGGLLGVKVGGEPVVLSRVGGQIYAIGGICTHKPASLEEGTIEGGSVRCPRHGGCFDIRTGEAVRPPATRAVPTYEVKVEGGRVLVGRRAG
ncbi:MAG: non-heme iron oxygenase ferredoxin subunit [Chloroflexi bacterium]|nr:non-heme iron oxygenase ferredoxin subunit [Chloroflexota bacterium]